MQLRSALCALAAAPLLVAGWAPLPAAGRAAVRRRVARAGRPNLRGPLLAGKDKYSSSKDSAPEVMAWVYLNEGDPQGDAWRIADSNIVDLLREGGVGVIPTDSGYAFVCDAASRKGAERILALKRVNDGAVKPLSLLCKDLSAIGDLTIGLDRGTFRVLKATLPGAWTYVCPASEDVPRLIVTEADNSSGKRRRKSMKRAEIGVRWPKDEACQVFLDAVGTPLLCSTVPVGVDGTLSCDAARVGDDWCSKIDFVIDSGPRPGGATGTTIVDFCVDPPRLLRDGLGDVQQLRDLVDLDEMWREEI